MGKINRRKFNTMMASSIVTIPLVLNNIPYNEAWEYGESFSFDYPGPEVRYLIRDVLKDRARLCMPKGTTCDVRFLVPFDSEHEISYYDWELGWYSSSAIQGKPDIDFRAGEYFPSFGMFIMARFEA